MSEKCVTRPGGKTSRDAELDSVIANFIRVCDAGAVRDQRGDEWLSSGGLVQPGRPSRLLDSRDFNHE